MTTQPVIMVQIADREWTLEALHCACVLARKMAAKIVLVDMVPVPYPTWIGIPWGYINFTEPDRAELIGYQTTIEDYGVECGTELFQYVNLTDATIQVAAYVNAQIIFARQPQSILAFWAKFQRRLMQREFNRQNRRWIRYPVYDPDALESVIEAISESRWLFGH